jgi:hypothetical protein
VPNWREERRKGEGTTNRQRHLSCDVLHPFLPRSIVLPYTHPYSFHLTARPPAHVLFSLPRRRIFLCPSLLPITIDALPNLYIHDRRPTLNICSPVL